MAQYLPVLLVSVSAVSSNTPDDSSLDAQAIGQVDYLSHEWQEEDVAKSWRNMTRRKDSIQNGARLENASWRTWWKQRNNLPTVSPETLNWLKDSDVTWLYGPLHTAADWAPRQHHLPEPEARATARTATSHPDGGLRSRPARSNSPWSLKPILKHRSISELLSISLHPSPGSDPMELDEEQSYFDPTPTASSKTPRADAAAADESRKRPKLTHTKSDSNVHQGNPFRRDSPPLPLGRSRDSSCGDSATGTHTAPRGRHISFNTFVEQCIAIEKPKKALYDLGGFDERDDDEFHDDDDDEEDSEEESEDDVLEMRPTPRSRSSSSRRTPSLSGASASTASAFGSSPEREHVTIAPIAPTVLKTSTSASPVGEWSIWEDDDADDEAPLFARADSVNLVYVPPQGSVYAERMHTAKISPPRGVPEPRAASFDDATLLPARLAPAFDPPFDPSFDFMQAAAEHAPPEPPRAKGSSGSLSDEGTVVLPPVPIPAARVPPASTAIPVPRAPPSAGIPVPRAPTSSAGIPVPRAHPSPPSPSPSFLEPPPRGRSTSPTSSEAPRGRSRSRGSLEGSVSPRSGSHSRLGRRAAAGLGTSLSPENGGGASLSPEAGDGAARRAVRRAGSDAESVSPPDARARDEDAPRSAIPAPASAPAPTPASAPAPTPASAPAPTPASAPAPTPASAPASAVQLLVPDEPATLVGRAADMVSSARGYLGSFWGAGERYPVAYTPGAPTEAAP